MSTVTPPRPPGGRVDLQGLQDNYEQLLTEFETWTQQHSSAGSSKQRSRLQPLPTPHSDSKVPTSGKDQDPAPAGLPPRPSPAAAAGLRTQKALTPVAHTKDASKQHDTIDTRAAPDATKPSLSSGGRALAGTPKGAPTKPPAADWTPGGGARRKLEPLLEGVETPLHKLQAQAGVAASSVAAATAGGMGAKTARAPSKSAPRQSSSDNSKGAAAAAAAGAGGTSIPSRRHSSSDVEGRLSHLPAVLTPLPAVGGSTHPEQGDTALVSGSGSSSRRRSHDAGSVDISTEAHRTQATSSSSSRQAYSAHKSLSAAEVFGAGTSHRMPHTVVAAAMHAAGLVAEQAGSTAPAASASGGVTSSSKLPRLPPLLPNRDDQDQSAKAASSSSKGGSIAREASTATAVVAQRQQPQVEGDVVRKHRSRVPVKPAAKQHQQQQQQQVLPHGAAGVTSTSRSSAWGQAGPATATGCIAEEGAPGPTSGYGAAASQGSTPRLAAEPSSSTWGRPPPPTAEESCLSTAGLGAEGSRASVGGSGLSSESMRLLQALRNRRVAALLHGPHPHHPIQQGLGATGAAAAAALGAGGGGCPAAAIPASIPEQAATGKLPPLPRAPGVVAASAFGGVSLSAHLPAAASGAGGGSGAKPPGRHSRSGSWGSQPPSRQSSASLAGDSELMPVGAAPDSSHAAGAAAHRAGAHGTASGSRSSSRSSSTEHGHAASAQQQEGPAARGGLLLPPLPGSRRSSASQVPAEEVTTLPPVAGARGLGSGRAAAPSGAEAAAGAKFEGSGHDKQQVLSRRGSYEGGAAWEGDAQRRVSSSSSGGGEQNAGHGRQGRARWEVAIDPPHLQQQHTDGASDPTPVQQHHEQQREHQHHHQHHQQQQQQQQQQLQGHNHHYQQQHGPCVVRQTYDSFVPSAGQPDVQGYNAASSSACAWTIPAPAGPPTGPPAAGEPWSGAVQQPAAVWPVGGNPHSNVLVCHEAAGRSQQQGPQMLTGQYPPNSMQSTWQQQQQQHWAWQQQQQQQAVAQQQQQQQQAVAQQHAYAYHQQQLQLQQQQQQAMQYGHYYQQQQPQQAHVMQQYHHHHHQQQHQLSFTHHQQHVVQQQQQQQQHAWGGVVEAGAQRPAAEHIQQAPHWQHAQHGDGPAAVPAGAASGEQDARGAGRRGCDQERDPRKHGQPLQPAAAAGRAPARVRAAPDVPWATYLDDEPQQQQEEPQHKAAAANDEPGSNRDMAGTKGTMSGMSASAIAKQRAEQQRAAWAGLSLGELLTRKLKPAPAAATQQE